MNGKKLNKDNFERLLEKQAQGKTSASENQKIDLIWEQIHDRNPSVDWKKNPELQVKERIRSRIKDRISITRKSRIQTLGNYFLKTAAVFLILSFGYIIFNSIYKKEVVPVAILNRNTNSIQRAQVTLPDGTLVHLNVNSRLSFPEKFEQDSRMVQLEGEAFFEVTHDVDRPFLVQSSKLTTQVLGTSFNITSYAGEENNVTVKSGKVQVSLIDNEDQKVFLLPNESVTLPIDSQRLITEKVDAALVIGWTSGKLEFEGVPFNEVIARLEKYYHTPLLLNNFEKKGCLITASFENKGLNFILSNLQLLVDFKYRENEKGDFIIDFKSC